MNTTCNMGHLIPPTSARGVCNRVSCVVKQSMLHSFAAKAAWIIYTIFQLDQFNPILERLNESHVHTSRVH
jgi:hypothetical protein